MKKIVNLGLALALATTMNSVAFAKSEAPKAGKGFMKTKKEKIAKLEAKKETIEKRISCIKKAKNAKEVKQCEKKYKLVNRKAGKIKKMAKKMKKSKKKNK